MTESPDTLSAPTTSSRRKPFLWGCFTGVLGTILALVLLMIGLVALTYVKPIQDKWVASKRSQLKTAAPSSGLAGDYSLKLEQVDGPPLKLESLKGKPVFLHFWSPTCFNCLPELAGLNQLHQSLEGSGVAFLAVAIAGFDELPRVAKENGVNFPLYYCKTALPECYQGGTPVSVILSPSGDIVLKHKGSARWDSPAITALLKGLSVFTPQSETP